MKVAVVGAGFAGLATCYYLRKSNTCDVTLFDKIGVGAGASGVASGLVHPYVGEQVRRSALASEALEETKYLLSIAQHFSEEKIADFSGIERMVDDDATDAMLRSHMHTYGDISEISPYCFHIHSGITVQTDLYLKALWLALSSYGVHFQRLDVQSLDLLDGFDCIVVAAGYGVRAFKEFASFRLDSTRGQTLKCHHPMLTDYLKRSVVGKGYLALSPDRQSFCAGSTYERGQEFLQAACAQKEISLKVSSMCPDLDLRPIETKAGFRVSSKGHYFPLIGHVKDRIWVMTGLGSRGLLYHALFSKMLSQAILTGCDDHIPEIVKLLLSKNRELSYNHLQLCH
jgi:glycine/D-amino acid oxidase-like deaminating enzyme